MTSSTTFRRAPVNVALMCALVVVHATGQGKPATVEDAIAMTRIRSAALDGGVVALSPDGSRFAAVVWRGDLARNVNVYSLLVFDVADHVAALRPPRVVMTREFEGDPNQQFASPIADLTFLSEGLQQNLWVASGSGS